jgi:hypothetical protein
VRTTILNANKGDRQAGSTQRAVVCILVLAFSFWLIPRGSTDFVCGSCHRECARWGGVGWGGECVWGFAFVSSTTSDKL